MSEEIRGGGEVVSDVRSCGNDEMLRVQSSSPSMLIAIKFIFIAESME